MTRGLGAMTGTAVAAAALAHAAPALAAVGPLRRAVLPGYAGRGDPGHLALTFDDGPCRTSTPRFLELLAEREIRATFFVLGACLASDPGLGRDMVAGGHELAVHGWHHRLLIRRTPAAAREDLRRAHGLVGDLAGRPPCWYRPPYGVASTAALRTATGLGMRPVLWTAWGRDWTPRATPDSIRRAVLRVRPGGGTVLLHDADTYSSPGSWWATLAALSSILDVWQAHGMRVGPLSEHAASRAGPAPRTVPGPGAVSE